MKFVTRNNAWTLLIYSAVLFSLVLQQPFLKLHIALVAVGMSLLLATAYRFNLLFVARVLHGLTICYGSLIFGFIFYMALPINEQQTDHPPGQRFDIAIFGTLLGIFFLFLTLFYYYRLRRTENAIPEKYFAYALFTTMSVCTLISFLTGNY